MTTPAAKSTSHNDVKPTEACEPRSRSNKHRTTKKAQLIQMLSRKAGADVASISDKLGWQQHTTRAAVSGLRKAGYEVANVKPANGGVSKYRITAEPAGDTA